MKSMYTNHAERKLHEFPTFILCTFLFDFVANFKHNITIYSICPAYLELNR